VEVCNIPKRKIEIDHQNYRERPMKSGGSDFLTSKKLI